MKKIIISAFAFCAFAYCTLFAASPAATQEWVMDYVSRNASGGGALPADYSTNSVNGIINNTFLAAALSLASATNAAYKVTTAPETNYLNKVLAPLSDTAWTNVCGIAFSTNATTATCYIDGVGYDTTNYTSDVIYFYDGGVNPAVVILSYNATDDEITAAKEGN